MTSAALDACLCLLLLSAAAVTVTSAPTPEAGPGDANRADAVAETLAATTAEVPYRLRPVPGSAGDDNPELRRVAHGTLVSLLADAAVRTVHVDGEALTGTSEGFAAAVRETVAEQLPPRTRVEVTWEPVPGGDVGRAFAVGPSPPPDADVYAATVFAPSGVDGLTDRETANQSPDAIGRAAAESLVAGLLPPEKGRLALAGDPPVDDLVRHRYQRVDEQYGVDTDEAIDRGATHAANRLIAAAMADRIAADLRGPGDSDEVTVRLELETVEISVRTWSP